MMRALSILRLRSEFNALEVSAERAGRALACVYSSSDEFEAAVIQARRRDGRIGPSHASRLRYVLGATAIVAAMMLATVVL
jgi:hypothetical protein